VSLTDNGDDQHDEMVDRIDAGLECPHCHSNSIAIRETRDLTGAPLFVCGCAAQWTSYVDVTRPQEAV
jgi:hypothetical protein